MPRYSDEFNSRIPLPTEPKMKYYTAVKESLQKKTKAQIDKEAEIAEQAMAEIFEDILSKIKVNVY